MKRKAVSGIMLSLILIGMFGLALDIQSYFQIVGAVEWVPYSPPSEIVYLEFWMPNQSAYINIEIYFPYSYFQVLNWGEVVKDGRSLWVDSEIWELVDGCPPAPMVLSHVYDLGELAIGPPYTFTFKAWGEPVKSISFDVFPIKSPEELAVIPEFPTKNDEVNVTVAFWFSTWPPYVEEFGPLTQSGNRFSVDVTIRRPAPNDVRLPIAGTNLHTYHLGKLEPGVFEFNVYVRYVHYAEGVYGLADSISFIVAPTKSIAHIYSLERNIESMGLDERVEDRLVGLLENAVEFLEENQKLLATITMFRFIFGVRIYGWFGVLAEEQVSHLTTRARETIRLVWE